MRKIILTVVGASLIAAFDNPDGPARRASHPIRPTVRRAKPAIP